VASHHAHGVAARIAAAFWAGCIIFGLVVGASGSASVKGAVLSDGPACPFRTVTGIDCPFCGMTRATLALGGGDVRGALNFHPLAPLVLAGMLGLMAAIIVGRSDVLMRGRRLAMILGVIVAIWVLRLVIPVFVVF
jgi:hypothetical protein